MFMCLATGTISSWIVQELLIDRKDAKAHHIIQAIGSSSLEKGKRFAAKHCPESPVTVYGTYDEVYADPDVDIVYIGTPHSFHKKNCIDAIAARKHVLCEKPFTVTAAEAEEVLAAAKAYGVFVMEGMWTRFNPLVLDIHRMLHEDKVIGDVRRVYCDFGLSIDFASLGPESRMKNPAFGAGSLLDVGIYSLTWGLICLDPGVGKQAEISKIVAVQTLVDEVDVASSILLHYGSTGRHGIVTSTLENKTDPYFCRIEGSEGYITVEGFAAANPKTFTVYPKTSISFSEGKVRVESFPGEVHNLETEGKGYYWQADAVALDIAAGRKENATMPHAETIRMMKIMDEIRRQGGARFPQDNV
jgi:predicted dehydrogenase